MAFRADHGALVVGRRSTNGNKSMIDGQRHDRRAGGAMIDGDGKPPVAVHGRGVH
jgi:hypothetical protein